MQQCSAQAHVYWDLEGFHTSFIISKVTEGTQQTSGHPELPRLASV